MTYRFTSITGQSAIKTGNPLGTLASPFFQFFTPLGYNRHFSSRAVPPVPTRRSRVYCKNRTIVASALATPAPNSNFSFSRTTLSILWGPHFALAQCFLDFFWDVSHGCPSLGSTLACPEVADPLDFVIFRCFGSRKYSPSCRLAPGAFRSSF